MLTYRTLCSGGELFGCGARAAGWHHADGYELDRGIAAVACANGFNVRCADVCDVQHETLVSVQHLHASPSCKTASRANTGAIETSEDQAVADAICRALSAHAAQGGRSFSLENVWAYRNYESFQRILATLTASGFIYRFDHVNSADFGVPQTRKRLILRAVHRSWRERVPGLRPTHGQRGGVLLARWVGWYVAIADLLPTLPPTEPAPWQLARMPKELCELLLISAAKSPTGTGIVTRGMDEPATTVVAGGEQGDRLVTRAYLIGTGGWEQEVVNRSADEPAFTMTSADNAQQIRAYLLDSKNVNQEYGKLYREDGEPSITVSADTRPSHRPVAYLIGGGNTGFAKVSPEARAADEPAFTLRDGRNGSPERAWLFGDQSASAGEGVQVRASDEPALTVRGRGGGTPRIYAGRWVRLTVQALGRFQTVPDDYRGLTSEINGNGVPSLLSQRIMESLT